MLTSEQQLAARNAADGMMPLAQDSANYGIPQRPLFNVVAGDYAMGSTISLETCFRLGLRVEVVE